MKNKHVVIPAARACSVAGAPSCAGISHSLNRFPVALNRASALPLRPLLQAVLLDNFENEAANLEYLRAALINFGVEDVPGLILGMIRMGVLTMPYDQLFLGMQYTICLLYTSPSPRDS